MKANRHTKKSTHSLKRIGSHAQPPIAAGGGEFLEEVRQLRAALAIYRHLVDRLLEKAVQ